MIPKTIHYCWYGRKKKPEIVEMCIQSWREYCPGYTIKEWNEDNSPLEIRWMKDAYKHQKFAFVADYARFYVLYNEGGIYLDTDMLLINSLDDFLIDSLFIGREDKYNASMGIIGAEKGSDFCQQILEVYDHTHFDVVSPPIITRFVTQLLFQYGFTEEDRTQRLTNGLIIYKSDYFYPIHYSQKFDLQDVLNYKSENTYAIHLWNKSWCDEFNLFEEGNYSLAYKEVLRRVKRTPMLPLKYWRKIIKYTGRRLGLWKR